MNNLNAIEEIDRIVDLLKNISDNNPCDEIAGCPYLDDADVECSQCGAIFAYNRVREEVEEWKKSRQLSQT